MTDSDSGPHLTPPPPPQRVLPVDYRQPGTQAGSQWLTDDAAFGGCLVCALLGLTALGAAGGCIGGLAWMLLGWW